MLGYPIADVDWVLGTDGTSIDAVLRMYDFMESAQFCGVAPGEPPHSQANGQIRRTYSLTNEVWKAVGLNQAIVPATRAIDCSLLRDLYQSGYEGEPDPNYRRRGSTIRRRCAIAHIAAAHLAARQSRSGAPSGNR